uniref:UPF0029 domain-containing protein n=1 Tax=Panagrellus redivivus TaxID=6233 RepID=A0A7E4VIV3_PANRE
MNGFGLDLVCIAAVFCGLRDRQQHANVFLSGVPRERKAPAIAVLMTNKGWGCLGISGAAGLCKWLTETRIDVDRYTGVDARLQE